MDFSLLLFGAAIHREPTYETWKMEPTTITRTLDDGVRIITPTYKKVYTEHEYNNFNPGLGLRISEPLNEYVKLSYSLGGYVNSYNEWSNFTGPSVLVGKHVGLEFGAAYVDGYANNNRIVPIVGAYVEYGRFSIHAVALDTAVGFYGEVKL